MKNPLHSTATRSAKRFWLQSISFWALLLLLAPLSKAAQNSVDVPMKEVAGYEIVQVSINGTGPYDFILDTGSNTTLVQRRLLDQLHIRCSEASPVHMATGESNPLLATVERVAIAGLGVDHLQVDTLEAERVGALNTRVEGVLGENFLKHFDLLLDNEKHTLTLDPTAVLGSGLMGEHLHLFHSGSFGSDATPDRMIVDVRVPSWHQKALKFLLDTGTNTAILFPAKGRAGVPMEAPHKVEMHSYEGRITCGLERENLELGNSTLEGIDLSECAGLTRDKMDTDGLLPTIVFRRLFISHRGAYVIANPQPTQTFNEALVEVALSQ